MLKILRSETERLTGHFAKNPLTESQKTRIALFLQAVKMANAAILAKVELQPMEWFSYCFLHDQFFKQLELSTLLARTISWPCDPGLYIEATRINLLLWQKADIARHVAERFDVNASFFEYLALSHALLSEIRFVPLFPPAWDFGQPFLYAISEIEDDNSRQMQIQLRLLKELDLPLSLEQREEIIKAQRQIVGEIFGEFLKTLVAEAA